jgi:hypothetical protein
VKRLISLLFALLRISSLSDAGSRPDTFYSAILSPFTLEEV